MLENGLNLNDGYSNDHVIEETPLSVAIENMDYYLTEYLLKHGAAHLIQKALRDSRHKLGLSSNGKQRNHIEAGQNGNLRQNDLRGSGPVSTLIPDLDLGDNLLLEDGRHGSGHGGEYDTAHRHRKQHRIGGKEHFQQSEQDLSLTGGAFSLFLRCKCLKLHLRLPPAP